MMKKTKEINNPLKNKEEQIESRIGHKRIEDVNSTTYIVYAVLKVKNNPHNTRWSVIKGRIDKALKREFGEDLV